MAELVRAFNIQCVLRLFQRGISKVRSICQTYLTVGLKKVVKHL